MSKHDESRRAFLVGAAVGAVGAGLKSADALAQNQTPPATTGATDPTHAHASRHGAFFNGDDAATVAAFTERLVPGAPGQPGAREANVLNYIDLALAGAYADQQDFYRRGLAALDAYCRASSGKPFAELAAAQQDDVITALEAGKASHFWRAMGASLVWRAPVSPAGAPGAHHEGGTRMGSDPKTSVVNRYGQSWDIPNLFVVGSSTFPTMSGFNPTLTIQALAYLSADAIVNRYRKNPGALL